MALFRKKNTATTNIPELQEYYANQQKESTGKAWFLAVGSLLVTVVILVGAFYGGRWIYRKATNDDKPKVTTTQTQTQTAGSTLANDDNKSSDKSTTSDTKASTPTSSATSPSTATTTTAPAQGVATTQSAETNRTATAASTTSTASSLPDTGPKETIAVLLSVLAVSYVLHNIYLHRQLNK